MAPAEQAPSAPGVRVVILAGRFAGEAGRLTGVGPKSATVDLGKAIDGGSGVVVVPVGAVREVGQ
jgi:hypothetical protein